MIDDDNDADDFDNGIFDSEFVSVKSNLAISQLMATMAADNERIIHMPYSNSAQTSYIFSFEINDSFDAVDRYSNVELRTDYRLYSEHKVYFIKLIRTLLDTCGLKEAKDLVENVGQPHRRFRDEHGVDWHVFTVRINSVEKSMRIMTFILKIMTATDRIATMKTEIGQVFTIRNVEMKPLHNLDYFTID